MGDRSFRRRVLILVATFVAAVGALGVVYVGTHDGRLPTDVGGSGASGYEAARAEFVAALAGHPDVVDPVSTREHVLDLDRYVEDARARFPPDSARIVDATATLRSDLSKLNRAAD